MIADHSADFGAVPSTELVGGVWTPAPFWTWQPYITQDTNPAAVPPGEEAMAGQDNWLHAVVHNRGPAVANNVVVTWHVVDWAGTEFQYPADWGPANQVAATTIPSITPGADELVEVLWPQASVDIVAGFVHPCVLVEAACAQDLGGDLGPYVQQYNNIAQRNISFAPSGSFEAGLRQAVLPFAVGHRLAPARRVRLAADVSQLAPARAWLDLDPDPNHPSVRRITEADAARRRSQEPCFDIEADDESRFTVRFCGLRASVVLTSGSRISLPSGGVAGVDRANLRLTDASWVVREHKEVIGLTGAAPSVELSLGAGEVVPVAVVIEVPPGVDRPVAVHVGQIDGSVPTGGVTLVVEAAP